MTLVLELTPEEQTRLKAAAESQGMDAQSVVRNLIAGLPTKVDASPTIGSQILEEWEREEVLGMWQDRPDSPAYARELRTQAETRGTGA